MINAGKQFAVGIILVLVVLAAAGGIYLFRDAFTASKPGPSLEVQLADIRTDYNNTQVTKLDEVFLEMEAYQLQGQEDVESLSLALAESKKSLTEFSLKMNRFYELKKSNQGVITISNDLIKELDEESKLSKELLNKKIDEDKTLVDLQHRINQIKTDVINPTLAHAKEVNNEAAIQNWKGYEQSWKVNLQQTAKAYELQLVKWRNAKEDHALEHQALMAADRRLVDGLKRWRLDARLDQELIETTKQLSEMVEQVRVQQANVKATKLELEESQFRINDLQERWAKQRISFEKQLEEAKVVAPIETAATDQDSMDNPYAFLITSLLVALGAFLFGALTVAMISHEAYKHMTKWIPGIGKKSTVGNNSTYTNHESVRRLVEERHREAVTQQREASWTSLKPVVEDPKEVDTIVSAIDQLTTSIKVMSSKMSGGPVSDQFLPDASLATGSLSEIALQAEDLASKANQKVSAMSEAQADIQKITEMMKEVAHNVSRLSVNVSIEVAASTGDNAELGNIVKELKELSGETVEAVEMMASQISGLKSKSEESQSAITELSQAVQVVSLSAKSLSKMMSLPQEDDQEHSAEHAEEVADELMQALRRIRVKDEAEKTSTN